LTVNTTVLSESDLNQVVHTTGRAQMENDGLKFAVDDSIRNNLQRRTAGRDAWPCVSTFRCCFTLQTKGSYNNGNNTKECHQSCFTLQTKGGYNHQKLNEKKFNQQIRCITPPNQWQLQLRITTIKMSNELFLPFKIRAATTK